MLVLAKSRSNRTRCKLEPVLITFYAIKCLCIRLMENLTPVDLLDEKVYKNKTNILKLCCFLAPAKKTSDFTQVGLLYNYGSDDYRNEFFMSVGLQL